ncbi:MAG: hypothetical protein QM706_16725 [Nitrospira sp.]
MDILIVCLIVLTGWSVWIGFPPLSRWHKKDKPAQLDSMPEPHNRLLTAHDEHQAFKAGQPIWIRYEDTAGRVTERVIEIYRPGDGEVLYTWCRRKQAPRTFVRRNIRSWRLLPERFDFDPHVAQYWDEERIRERFAKNPWRHWLKRQPKEIANRYK